LLPLNDISVCFALRRTLQVLIKWDNNYTKKEELEELCSTHDRYEKYTQTFNYGVERRYGWKI